MKGKLVVSNENGKTIKEDTLEYVYLASREVPPTFVIILPEKKGSTNTTEIYLDPRELLVEILSKVKFA